MAVIHESRRGARWSRPQADLRIATMDLQQLMRAETPDRAKIDAQIDRLAQLRAGMQKSRTATAARGARVLTPEQLKKCAGRPDGGRGRGRLAAGLQPSDHAGPAPRGAGSVSGRPGRRVRLRAPACPILPGMSPGSMICPDCGKLIGVDEERCPFCGAWRPGFYGMTPQLQRLFGGRKLDLNSVIVGACVALYVAALALQPSAIFQMPVAAAGSARSSTSSRPARARSTSSA